MRRAVEGGTETFNNIQTCHYTEVQWNAKGHREAAMDALKKTKPKPSGQDHCL